jgi:hypothetical protein
MKFRVERDASILRFLWGCGCCPCASVFVEGLLWEASGVGRDVDPDELAGCVVVEVGKRQAWPFITFADCGGAPSREARLYLDSLWQVRPPSGSSGALPDSADACRLLDLNSLTVERAQVSEAGDLKLCFADGSSVTVSGAATADTAGEPWWFTPWTFQG